ncbi:hypothetical protein B484DRAFT_452273 [Ochromonadaceae sp. CCMP2298]|nr:hypothetical protein B484DRAFT_452273 [Ochromonadaceae sp. CCMP2298]
MYRRGGLHYYFTITILLLYYYYTVTSVGLGLAYCCCFRSCPRWQPLLACGMATTTLTLLHYHYTATTPLLQSQVGMAVGFPPGSHCFPLGFFSSGTSAGAASFSLSLSFASSFSALFSSMRLLTTWPRVIAKNAPMPTSTMGTMNITNGRCLCILDGILDGILDTCRSGLVALNILLLQCSKQ